jgi:hypothetical protein
MSRFINKRALMDRALESLLNGIPELWQHDLRMLIVAGVIIYLADIIHWTGMICDWMEWLVRP